MFNTLLLILGIVLVIIFFKFFWFVSSSPLTGMNHNHSDEKFLMPVKVSAIHKVKKSLRKINRSA